MRRLLAIAVVLVTAGPARASKPDGAVMVGVGAAVATTDPGWMLRIENRIGDPVRSEESPIAGARMGLEVWKAGRRGGFAMPIGSYFGGQTGPVRTTLGGGVGLWAFKFGDDDDTKFGVAPFAAASVELTADNLVISIDGRLARQVVFETPDFNVYSVMVMLGRRFGR